MSGPKIIWADADGFANNTEPALVFLEISKNSIATGNIASALERLHIIADSAEKTRLYKESLVISVAGFDDDPRELIEIQEVRKFFQRLTEDWPHWFWFLNHETGSVGLLLAMLCEVRVIRTENGTFSEFKQNKEVEAKIRDLIGRGSALFTAYGISPEEAAESSKKALKDFAR